MDGEAKHDLRDALVADDFEFPLDVYDTRSPQINRHFSTTTQRMAGKASQKVAKVENTAPVSGDGGKKKKSNRMTNTQRAGLEFPVGRIVRKIRNAAGKQQRVSVTAGVYAASILEYIVAEVIELAGNASKDLKMKRISPRHLYLAFHGDEELEKLIKTVIIAGGGVVPLIHPVLYPRGHQQKQPVEQNIAGEQTSG